MSGSSLHLQPGEVENKKGDRVQGGCVYDCNSWVACHWWFYQQIGWLPCITWARTTWVFPFAHLQHSQGSVKSSTIGASGLCWYAWRHAIPSALTAVGQESVL
jgi:hypothetical protein